MLGKRCRLKSIYQDERGMSLIEVVIILVILGITVVPLSRLAVNNQKSGGRFATMNRALFHAEEAMEQIVADYMATDASRGYDWVIANWSGQSTPEPPAGITGSVSISAEDSLNGVKYVVVQTTVGGTDINSITLTTWLVSDH